jgi:hypothetical protein
MDYLFLTRLASLGITVFGALLWSGIVVRSVLQRASLIAAAGPQEQRILSDGEILMSIMGTIAFLCLFAATTFGFLLPGTVAGALLGDGVSIGDVLRILIIMVELCFAGVGLIWVWTQSRFTRYRIDAARRADRRSTDKPRSIS